jgi:hypothetical protein
MQVSRKKRISGGKIVNNFFESDELSFDRIHSDRVIRPQREPRYRKSDRANDAARPRTDCADAASAIRVAQQRQ